MTDAKLEPLKRKYQSVLDLMKELKVQLKNLHVQNDKLVLRAEARTKGDMYKVWDRIKAVDSDYALDLAAEIAYLSEEPAPKPQNTPTIRIHKVVAGDTLSKIALQYYGKANEYMKIFKANQDKLKDPDKIFPGQDLVIP